MRVPRRITACQLQEGNFNNTGVAVLQWLSFNECHHAGLRVDGDYGPLTRNVGERLRVPPGPAECAHQQRPEPFVQRVFGDQGA